MSGTNLRISFRLRLSDKKKKKLGESSKTELNLRGLAFKWHEKKCPIRRLLQDSSHGCGCRRRNRRAPVNSAGLMIMFESSQ